MKYEIPEKSVGLLALCMAVAMSIGGLTQIVPSFFWGVTNTSVEDIEPYTALQLEGHDIYIREGCVGRHSQMVRLFRAETECYDHYSVVDESVWNRPFPWSSKCTGPDLTRAGSRCSDGWRRVRLFSPRNAVPEPKIPTRPWLVENKLDGKDIRRKFEVMCILGTPYTDEDIKGAKGLLKGKTEMSAAVAYLQVLGTLIRNKW